MSVETFRTEFGECLGRGDAAGLDRLIVETGYFLEDGHADLIWEVTDAGLELGNEAIVYLMDSSSDGARWVAMEHIRKTDRVDELSDLVFRGTFDRCIHVRCEAAKSLMSRAEIDWMSISPLVADRKFVVVSELRRQLSEYASRTSPVQRDEAVLLVRSHLEQTRNRVSNLLHRRRLRSYLKILES